MIENVNPHSIETEQEILGAIILENNLLHKITLSTDDFYSIKHREIYKAILELDLDGMPIDFVSLNLKIKKEYIIYLSQLVQRIVTTGNIKFHSDILKEFSSKRRLRTICIDILNTLDEPLDNLLTKLRNSTASLVKGRGGNITPMSDVVKGLDEFLKRRSKNRNILSGVPSGFLDLDELTDGFQNGDLNVIAGRPGSGKSALAMGVSQNAGVPVGVISIEMGPHQIGIRTLASLSKVELWRLRKGILSYEHWGDITPSLNRMKELPIYFSFSSKNTTEIEKVITQMVEVYDCQMIIVDYLQLTKSTEYKRREEEVAEISRLLKMLAQSNNIPIIALSQLNREVERRENKRPILSDLRESGAIEQDADVVIFLYREKMESDGVVEVIISKGRNIGLGTIKLFFRGDTMTFTDLIEDKRNQE